MANVYLHYVFDLWTHRWRRKATGDVIAIRYADDTIAGGSWSGPPSYLSPPPPYGGGLPRPLSFREQLAGAATELGWVSVLPPAVVVPVPPTIVPVQLV